MVSADNRLGLYVALPVYFVLLTGCAVYAYVRVERIKRLGISDHLSAHYLGGRSFGPLLTAGTVFASFFSGYTVVGVVNGELALWRPHGRQMVSICRVIVGTSIHICWLFR